MIFNRSDGRFWPINGIIMIFALWVNVAAAAQSAALVVSIEGSTDPALSTYSEVDAGQIVRLLDDATIELLHYHACEQIIVKGGEIRIEQTHYLISGVGDVVDKKTHQCPRTLTLNEDASIGGVILRSFSLANDLRLSTNPSFILTGPNAARYDRIQIKNKETAATVFSGPVLGPDFSWPENRQPLTAGEQYQLVFHHTESGKTRAIEFVPVHARELTTSRLTIIRME